MQVKSFLLILSLLLVWSCHDDGDISREVSHAYSHCGVADTASVDRYAELANVVDLEGTPAEQARMYYALSCLYRLKGDFSMALNSARLSVLCLREDGVQDSLLAYRIYLSEALVYAQVGDRRLAAVSHAKAQPFAGVNTLKRSERLESERLFRQLADSTLCDSRLDSFVRYVEKDCRAGMRHAVLIDLTQFFLGFFVCLIVFLVVRYFRKRSRTIRRTRQLYLNTVDELEKVRLELSTLASDRDTAYDALLAEKQELADHLGEVLAELESKQNIRSVVDCENKLCGAPVVERFRHFVSHPLDKPSSADWMELRTHIIDVIPEFFTEINRRVALRTDEERMCMLVRLHFKPSSVAVLLDVSKQSVSVCRARLCTKVFGSETASASLFDKKLLELR